MYVTLKLIVFPTFFKREFVVHAGLSLPRETLKGNGPSRRRSLYLLVSKVCVVKQQLTGINHIKH